MVADGLTAPELKCLTPSKFVKNSFLFFMLNICAAKIVLDM